MAFVLLPCDLPTWPTICRHLQSLRGADCPKQVTQTLLTLHSLCNVSIDPDPDDSVPKDYFAGVERFLSHEVGPDFFSVTLPALLDAALSLKERKPQQGLTYSLQQQNDEIVLKRPLVSSLLAHIFFCTMPRRSSISHPTLTDPCLAPVFSSMHSDNMDDMKSQRVKIEAFLHYFTLLVQQPVDGHITYSRKVMGAQQFVTLGQWQDCEWPLCPVVIQHEGRIETAVKPCLLATFSSADVASPALSRHNSQQVCTMLSYPELLASAVFTERLEDNEVMQVTGALHTATVQDLRTKPSFIPRYQDTSPGNVIHALMDADDYKQSDVLQYEQINVLRELNKAFLAFTQPIPIGLVSPAISDITSVSRQNSHGSTSPATQYRTQVSSNEHSEDQLSKEENNKRTTQTYTLEEKNSDIKKINKCLENLCLEDKKMDMLNEKINKNNNIISNIKEVVSGYLDDRNVYNSDMSSCSCNDMYISQQINEVDLKETNELNNSSSIKMNSNGNDIPKLNDESVNISIKEDQKRKEHTSKICDRNKLLGIILENIQMPQPPREDEVTDDKLVDQKSKVNKNSDDINVVSVADVEIKANKSGDNEKSPMLFASDRNKGNISADSNVNAEIIVDDGNKVRSVADSDKGFSTQDTESGFVTASTTIKRPRKRNRKKNKANKKNNTSDTTSKGVPLVIVDPSQIKNKEDEKVNDDSSEIIPKDNLHIEEKIDGNSTSNEETTRLLNKVLRAIQKLEEERPELLEEAVQEEQHKQQPEIMTRGKPPLPETKKFSKSSETRVEVVPSVEQFLKQSQYKEGLASDGRREGTARDGRKLSIYQTCPEEYVQSSVEDPYYSACESLENQDVSRPHRRRGSKRNQRKGRRKSSFAERLKETLARGDSKDENISEALPCLDSDQELDNRLSRQDSRESYLREEETPVRPIGLCLGKHNPGVHFVTNTEEQDLEDLEMRGLSGADDDDEDEDDDDYEEFRDEDGEDRRDNYERNDSDESRYSFSSDYSSDLEDVFEQLGQVLDDNEDGLLAPRQAAVARFAHGLFKRALSESYKGVTLRLDGSAVSGSTSEAALPPRSKSLNEHTDDVQQGMTKHNMSIRLPPQLWEDRRRAVVTGNWGCGSLKGDHQLKAMIQWCATSRAGAPRMIYYTCGNQNTVKLDIVCRLLTDRGWRVGELVATLLQYCNQRLDAWKAARKQGLKNVEHNTSETYRYNNCLPLDSLSLFDELIGADRPYVHLETEL